MQDAINKRFFGRRKGRKLSKRSESLLKTLLPKLIFTFSDQKLDLASNLFCSKNRPIFLEIGFGYGENIANLSIKRPEWGFVGFEPYLNGVASLLNKIDDKGLSNIRISTEDCRPFIEKIKSNSISEIAVLFPDPWPKKKHVCRRFIQKDTVDQLVRIIKPSGNLVIASDDIGTQKWILSHFLNHNLISWKANSSEDWKVIPNQFSKTRYMEKAEANGRKTAWFSFVKL